MTAKELFEKALYRTRGRAHSFRFFQERDIVWTIHKYLLEMIAENDLPFTVNYNFQIDGNGKFYDIGIFESKTLKLVAEFKYEPDHRRKQTKGGDIPNDKLIQPVVIWDEVIKDINRVKSVATNEQPGYAILIDEGRQFKNKHPKFKSTVKQKGGDYIKKPWGYNGTILIGRFPKD